MKSNVAEEMEKELTTLKAAQGLCLGVITAEVRKTAIKDSKGNPMPIVLSDEYHEAMAKYESQSRRILYLLEKLDDFSVEIPCPERMFYDENGELQFSA